MVHSLAKQGSSECGIYRHLSASAGPADSSAQSKGCSLWPCDLRACPNRDVPARRRPPMAKGGSQMVQAPVCKTMPASKRQT